MTTSVDAELLAQAQSGVSSAFERLVSPYRRQLYALCYRMLASAQDAEDALQEALLAAWRGLSGFEGRSALGTWLYQITTRTCLRLAAQRAVRLLSPDRNPAWTQTAELGESLAGPIWVEPCPDERLPLADELDPAQRYLQLESLELAFVAALQHLPPTQRATLILREVLDYPAAEVATMLETSVASVNSALQRARKTVAERVPGSQRVELDRLGQAEGERLVASFVSAWQRADLPALLQLLTDDAIFTMPPLPAWFSGRELVGRFFGERVFQTPWRLVPLRANGQLGLACYMQRSAGAPFELGAVNLLGLRDGKIANIFAFLDPAAQASFGLPQENRP